MVDQVAVVAVAGSTAVADLKPGQDFVDWDLVADIAAVEVVGSCCLHCCIVVVEQAETVATVVETEVAAAVLAVLVVAADLIAEAVVVVVAWLHLLVIEQLFVERLGIFHFSVFLTLQQQLAYNSES